MRTVALALLVVGAGCNALFGNDGLAIALDAAVDAVPPDAPPEFEDAGIDSNEERCVGSYKALCYLPNQQPTGNVVLTSLDTSDDDRCTRVVNQVDGPSLCLIAGTNISVATGGAIITGARPLMLYATDTINVAGALHAGSVETDPATNTRRLGPGANYVSGCRTPNNGSNGGNNAGDGGGAGGSFGTRGANGGRGASGGGGAGAVSANAVAPTSIRGGCRGSKGAGGPGPSSGAGGDGGGAVYLLAGAKITVAHRVSASGAGGTGSDGQEGGGGGGGSGGMIVLEAPVVEIAGAMAQLDANGGGGGEGTVTGSAADGSESPAWNERGKGGEGNALGGDGGDGATRAEAAEPGDAGREGSGNADGGGGGGGGGLGVILIKTPMLIGAQVGNISPAHVTTPTSF